MKFIQHITIILIINFTTGCRKDVEPLPDADIAWRSVYVGGYHKGSETVSGYPITCPAGPCAFIVESEECSTCATISSIKLTIAGHQESLKAYVYDQDLIIPDQIFSDVYNESSGSTAHLIKINGKAYFTNDALAEIFIFLYVFYKYENDTEFQFSHTMTSYLTRAD